MRDEATPVSPVTASNEELAESERNIWAREQRLDRHIALVGFMGAGKSSLGRALADRLQRPFFDTDLCVQESQNVTVQELFASGREAEFRTLEAAVIGELLAGPPAVLSLGGGALMSDSVRASLRERCFVIHLYLSWAEVRASLDGLRVERPLLQRPLADVHSLYLERQKTYRDADVRIHAPRDDIERAIEHVLYALRRAAR